MKLKFVVFLTFYFIINCDNTSNNQTIQTVPPTSKNPISQKMLPVVIPTAECINLKYSYPFNPKYILTLDLSEETKVKISIRDKNEVLIRELANQIMPPGLNKIFWDGKDNKGDSVLNDVNIHICKQETLIEKK
ncbi:MAG: hypothetical protein V3W20_09305 [Candidatus Neomarinimicrobiota bacterium]